MSSAKLNLDDNEDAKSCNSERIPKPEPGDSALLEKNKWDSALLEKSEKLFMIDTETSVHWDCIPIYNKMNWQIKRKLDMTTTEFKKALKNAVDCNKHKFIAINNATYAQIVTIMDNVNIAILYQFEATINKFKPGSIHLSGEYINKYHQSSDNFESNITHLNIQNEFSCVDDILFMVSLDGEAHSFSRQDIIDYHIVNFMNKWNDNATTPKSTNLANIIQCFGEYDVMSEYIAKGRRKDLMFLLKNKYNVKKALSSALWIYFTENSNN